MTIWDIWFAITMLLGLAFAFLFGGRVLGDGSCISVEQRCLEQQERTLGLIQNNLDLIASHDERLRRLEEQQSKRKGAA